MDSTEALVQQLRLEVARRSVRPKEFFLDFDPLRKGVVSEAQFHRAISMMDFHLTQPQFHQVALKYRTPQGISYASFCKDMDSAFLYEPVANPVKAAELINGSVRMSIAEEERVKAAMNELKDVMKTQRILLKPVLQDFDRPKIGHVTRSQFIRALTTTGLLPNSPDTLNLVLTHYACGYKGGYINYDRFCWDVDQIPFRASVISGSSEESAAQGITEKPSFVQPLTSTRFFDTDLPKAADPTEVETRLRAEVAMKNIRASEFFKDFDKLRRGVVGVGQFQTCLNILNIRLNDAELQALFSKYKVTNEEVRYVEFCRLIESSPQSLDKLPDVTPDPPTSTLPARRKYLPFTSEEQAAFQQAMLEYQTVIRCRGTHPRPRFQDFDKSRTGHVSRTQFGRVLNQLGILPPEAMLDLLLKRYLDKGNMEQVNYMDFCRDVDTPADIFRPERDYVIDIDEAVQLRKTMRESAIVRLPREDTGAERPELTSEEHIALEQCLTRLGAEMLRRRLAIGPLFREVDRTGAGWLTSTRFGEVFNTAQLPISEEEKRLLSKRFGNKVAGVKYPDLEEVLRYYSGELEA